MRKECVRSCWSVELSKVHRCQKCGAPMISLIEVLDGAFTEETPLCCSRCATIDDVGTAARVIGERLERVLGYCSTMVYIGRGLSADLELLWQTHRARVVERAQP
jgi:endogenous inhibitor of DNA gyrase (YacG/DUF329 family)